MIFDDNLWYVLIFLSLSIYIYIYYTYIFYTRVFSLFDGFCLPNYLGRQIQVSTVCPEVYGFSTLQENMEELVTHVLYWYVIAWYHHPIVGHCSDIEDWVSNFMSLRHCVPFLKIFLSLFRDFDLTLGEVWHGDEVVLLQSPIGTASSLGAGLASAGWLDDFHTQGPYTLGRTDYPASESRHDSIG